MNIHIPLVVAFCLTLTQLNAFAQESGNPESAAAKSANAAKAAKAAEAAKVTEPKPKQQAKAEDKSTSLDEMMTQIPMSVESLAEQVRPSLAVIKVLDRDGKEHGVGTGFVVDASGLIVTNMHVIGEGRQFRVELSDGSKPQVTAVHAWNRHLDLAVIRVSARNLKPLKLAAPDSARQGMPIVVMGNPHGLKNSVVAGILSGTREIDNREMMQMAIPVEPGNSGGPVVDAKGAVHGVVSMKSLVTENLGFAISVKFVKQLLDKPNRIAIDKWRTIGSIDPREWTVMADSKWKQRGGKIIADGVANGFAGRALCLRTPAPPELPYEVGVFVKLDDEGGAAGLVIHSDKKDKHYGFYPSAGRLRLTRFDGPNIFTWKVMRDEPNKHYRQGKINHLKVRVEKDRFLCFVNDQLVYESKDRVYQGGAIGLCKFRNTQATFTGFRVAAKLPPSRVTGEVRQTLRSKIDALPKLEAFAEDDIKDLVKSSDPAARLLGEKAAELEQRAAELRRFADDIHRRSIAARVRAAVKQEDSKTDLIRVCLLIAKLDEQDIDIESYLKQLKRMADDVASRFKTGTTDSDKIAILGRYLFKEQGFHGSRFDYYHRANSYMNRVIDDREGLPITLSILYMEFARYLGLDMEGVGLPGHFVVRHKASKGKGQLIDVFGGGKLMSRDDAEKLVWGRSQLLLQDEHLATASRKEIVQRVLRNLMGVAQSQGEKERLLGYLEVYVALDPDAIQERGLRAMTRFETGRRQAAIRDLDYFLDKMSKELDLEKIRQLRQFFEFRDPPTN